MENRGESRSVPNERAKEFRNCSIKENGPPQSASLDDCRAAIDEGLRDSQTLSVRKLKDRAKLVMNYIRQDPDLSLEVKGRLEERYRAMSRAFGPAQFMTHTSLGAGTTFRNTIQQLLTDARSTLDFANTRSETGTQATPETSIAPVSPMNQTDTNEHLGNEKNSIVQHNSSDTPRDSRNDQRDKKVSLFSVLRSDVHKKTESELKERRQKNPIPTDEEFDIGAFIEEIEPQVRDAVLALTKKGYSTGSSGFYGINYELQGVDGFFTLDEATKNKLNEIGVQVDEQENGYTWILFHPKMPDLEAIKAEWATITALIPDKSEPASLSQSDGSTMFRQAYGKKYLNKTFTTFDRLRRCINELIEEEEIEPQVRDAVLALNEKGYLNLLAGFYRENNHIQAINGDFTLDERTKNALKKIGVAVDETENTGTTIFFHPATPNLEAIKAEWAMITALIPHKGE